MTLQKYCQRKEIQYNEPLENHNLWLLKYSKKGKMMMCIVPKVASRNWYRVFLAIDGIYNASLVQDFDSTGTSSPITKKSEHWRVPGIDKATVEERQYVFASSHKILFVRNPYERLVSCYIDKFVLKHDPGFRSIIKTVKKMFVKHNPKREITFKEFIQFVIHEHKAGNFNKAYEHWLPITSICSPCFIRYDFIGKMETLIRDSQYILKQTKLEYQNLFPAKGADSWGISRKRQKENDVINEYFTQLGKEELAELYEMYKGDFEAFGYTTPNINPEKLPNF